MCAFIPLHGNIQLFLLLCRKGCFSPGYAFGLFDKSDVSSDLGLFLGLTLLYETEVLPAALRRLSFVICCQFYVEFCKVP